MLVLRYGVFERKYPNGKCRKARFLGCLGVFFLFYCRELFRGLFWGFYKPILGSVMGDDRVVQVGMVASGWW